jgi:radical SAM superfamily enzyme YgiQ (UPF0313 family)
MKVILVYVGIGVAGFNASRRPGDREGSWIGHGIASIGASLKSAGYEIELIDMRQLSGWEEFKERVANQEASIYGLSISAVDYHSALEATNIIKDVHPESKVIVGGIHPSVFPDSYRNANINTVVVGEGEITFVDLVKDIERKNELPTKIQGKKPDLDSIPWVDRELFNYRMETRCFFAPGQKVPSITMLAGRGCPYHCRFCQPAENIVFGLPCRIRGPENVVGELRSLKEKYEFKSITFWDDTFTYRKKWVIQFCDLYEKENFDATIAVCSRADIICKNEGMVERLASIGVDWFVIGFESGSQRILDFLRKDTTVEQNVEAAKICRKYGIKVFGTYMYGLPTETKEEALMTARMIDEIRSEHNSPFYFVPIPGTAIYGYCEENDLILDGVRDRSVRRTSMFQPALKGIDYNYLNGLRKGHRD